GKSFGFLTSSRRSWKRISPPLAGGLTWTAITFFPARRNSVAGETFGGGGGGAAGTGALATAGTSLLAPAFAGAVGFSGNGGTEYSCRPRLTRSSSFNSRPFSHRCRTEPIACTSNLNLLSAFRMPGGSSNWKRKLTTRSPVGEDSSAGECSTTVVCISRSQLNGVAPIRHLL